MLGQLELDWAILRAIKPKDIEHRLTRLAARGFKKGFSSNTTVEVWLCSDARNTLIREALDHLSFVKVFNVAGCNAYGSKRERAVAVIAHGPICGAVQYACTGDTLCHYPSFLSLDGDPKRNAGQQLQKFSEACRAGVLFYDHDTNKIEDVPEYDGKEVLWKKILLNELSALMDDSLTSNELELNKQGQDPALITLSDLSAPSIGRNVFTVDLQSNEINELVADSVQYALNHALLGKGSNFKNTATFVVALRSNENLPIGVNRFFSEKDRFLPFISRGGKIYFVEVGDLPSKKRIYRLDPI